MSVRAGIGKAIALKLAIAGAKVIVNGRSEKATAAAVEQINEAAAASGGSAIAAVADLSTVEGNDALVAAVEATSQPLDVLVCNVGVYRTIDFAATTDDDWEDYFKTNIMSTVRPCRSFLPGMIERNAGGRVIIVSSEAAFKPVPEMVGYSVTKAAQVNLARGLAEQTKGTTVTVNALLPGPTATEGVASYFEGLAKKDGKPAADVIKAYFATREPASLKQGLLDPNEVANTALFLASKASSATNGASVRAEGGLYRSI